MRKLIKTIIAIVLLLTTISIVGFVSENSHVHADGIVCPNCGVTGADIVFLGHVKMPTCTEKGSDKYKCLICEASLFVGADITFTIDVAPLGHNPTDEDLLPTCTEAGYHKVVCSRCKEELTSEIFEPLGHDFLETEKVEPDCVTDGYIDYQCSRCPETVHEVLPATGHALPDEWTITKEPGYFKEGEKTKICLTCGESITEPIEKKPITALIVIVVGGAVGIGLIGLGIKKLLGKSTEKVIKKAVDAVTDEAVESEIFKPSIKKRKIVTNTIDNWMYTSLKSKDFIRLYESEFADLITSVQENEPALLLIDQEKHKFEEILTILDSVEDTAVSLLLDSKTIQKQQKKL